MYVRMKREVIPRTWCTGNNKHVSEFFGLSKCTKWNCYLPIAQGTLSMSSGRYIFQSCLPCPSHTWKSWWKISEFITNLEPPFPFPCHWDYFSDILMHFTNPLQSSRFQSVKHFPIHHLIWSSQQPHENTSQCCYPSVADEQAEA